jgi:prepilin-type N-terminal cleavage/methylation domain-containing protein
VSARRGFTLIELMIVVCIIGLVAGIAVPKVLRARSRAQAAEAVGAMRAVRIGVTIYFDSAGGWPADGSPGVIPPGLVGYLPNRSVFVGKGWSLTWRQMTVTHGAATYQVGAVQLNALEAEICPAASTLLGGPTADLSVLCGPATGTVMQLIER